MIHTYTFLRFLLTISLTSVEVQSASFFVTPGFEVLKQRPVSDVSAYVEFSDKLKSTGWTELTVITNASFSDVDQARAAGIGEGYATADRIVESWTNTMGRYLSLIHI